jgi:hypothetical protein
MERWPCRRKLRLKFVWSVLALHRAPARSHPFCSDHAPLTTLELPNRSIESCIMYRITQRPLTLSFARFTRPRSSSRLILGVSDPPATNGARPRFRSVLHPPIFPLSLSSLTYTPVNAINPVALIAFHHRPWYRCCRISTSAFATPVDPVHGSRCSHGATTFFWPLAWVS